MREDDLETRRLIVEALKGATGGRYDSWPEEKKRAVLERALELLEEWKGELG